MIFCRGTSPDEKTIALKINSFGEAYAPDFVFSHETKNAGTVSIDVEISGNICSPVNGKIVKDLLDSEPVQNGVEKKKSSKMDKKYHVDNHSTDHNYACSGFPMRKMPRVVPKINGNLTTAPQVVSEINGRSTMNRSKPSPPKSLTSDVEHENHKLSNRMEILNSRKKQSSCDDSADKKSRIPKRYRGPYCEDSSEGECSRSEGECSSSSDEKRHSSSRSRHGSSDECNDNRRKQRKRKHSYSSDEGNYRKGMKRRHSLYSDDSSDERPYSSSDDDSKNERRCRYNPRQSESNTRHSSGSARDSGSCNRDQRRKRRPRSKDHSERDSDGKKNKNIHDIELERKMGFKFDQNIKGTAKVINNYLQELCLSIFKKGEKLRPCWQNHHHPLITGGLARPVI